jgi:SAM-dependent methyltransferase
MVLDPKNCESVRMWELLEAWVDHVPRGRALDLGAGEGVTARWLTSRGFTVDAIERDPPTFDRLKSACVGNSIRPHLADLRMFPLPLERYTLIVAQAVLHFLRPTDLWPLSDRLCHALVPEGFLLAEVFTTDDPSYGTLRACEAIEIEPNTFHLNDSLDVIHYFESQELRRVFAALDVMVYEENRRMDPGAQDSYHAGAALVARKPPAVRVDRNTGVCEHPDCDPFRS